MLKRDPSLSSDLLAEQVNQGPAMADVEAVKNQMDRGATEGHSCELESGSVRRGEVEVTASPSVLRHRKCYRYRSVQNRCPVSPLDPVWPVLPRAAI
jgi:hypothetical protein